MTSNTVFVSDRNGVDLPTRFHGTLSALLEHLEGRSGPVNVYAHVENEPDFESVLRSCRKAGHALSRCRMTDAGGLVVGPCTRGLRTACALCYSDYPNLPAVLRMDTRQDQVCRQADCATDLLGVGSSYIDRLAKSNGDMSPWGRVFEFEPTGGHLTLTSFRVAKNPDCGWCSNTAQTPSGLSSHVWNAYLDRSRLSRLFLQNTRAHDEIGMTEFVKTDLLDLVFDEAQPGAVLDQVSKRYEVPGALTPTAALSDVIGQRRSRRKYHGRDINFEELATILLLGNGVTGVRSGRVERQTLPVRAAPSAGGYSPIRMYAYCPRVKGVEHGIYYLSYNRRSGQHELVLIRQGSFAEDLSHNSFYGDMIQKASVVVILAVFFPYNQVKYMDTGLAHMLIDTGHVGQNIHLAATSLKLKSCCVRGFDASAANRVLQLDERVEEAVYMVTIGK